jgi:Kdo2-lipid IVA lauroyltransferase/acyltransferase
LPKPKLKHHVIYYAANILIGSLGLLPFAWMGFLGRGFGWLVFKLARKERDKTTGNIRIANSQTMTWNQAERLAQKVWIRLGWNLFEVARWMPMTQEEVVSQVVRVQGWENMEKALARNKGVLVLSAHLGNWELMGGYFSSKTPTVAVAQNLYDDRFDELVTWMRENVLKIPMIKRGLALRGILEALKSNHAICALVDQDTGNDGVFVPFFGKPAWTQSGVARIAYKTGAALVPAFVVRGADGRFELFVEKEIEFQKTEDAEKDVLEIVRRYTEVIETYVKAYPDQWMWMHERWKTKPPAVQL